MGLSRPLTDRHEMYGQVWCGLKAKSLFLPTLKIWRGKTSNLPQIMEDRRQSEAHNIEMAQHIDKQIFHISSTTNALYSGIKLGTTALQGFDAT